LLEVRVAVETKKLLKVPLVEAVEALVREGGTHFPGERPWV
jgi:hypothetical protein